MSNFSVLAILNQANNFNQNIQLSSPINANFVKFVSNRQALIKVSFLSDAYLINATTSEVIAESGLALAGSKIAYPVRESNIARANITLREDITSETEEVQIVCYFF